MVFIEPCSRSKLHRDMESVGVVTFLNLFETHPETMKPFLPHINSVREKELDEWYVYFKNFKKLTFPLVVFSVELMCKI
jgi:hypothetical protein